MAIGPQSIIGDCTPGMDKLPRLDSKQKPKWDCTPWPEGQLPPWFKMDSPINNDPPIWDNPGPFDVPDNKPRNGEREWPERPRIIDCGWNNRFEHKVPNCGWGERA